MLAQFWFSRCWPTASAVSSPGPSRLPVSISSREPEVNQGDLQHLSNLYQRLYPSSGVMPQEKVTQFLLVMSKCVSQGSDLRKVMSYLTKKKKPLSRRNISNLIVSPTICRRARKAACRLLVTEQVASPLPHGSILLNVRLEFASAQSREKAVHEKTPGWEDKVAWVKAAVSSSRGYLRVVLQRAGHTSCVCDLG